MTQAMFDDLADLRALEAEGASLSPDDSDYLYQLEHAEQAFRRDIAPLATAGGYFIYPLIAFPETLLRFVDSSNIDYISYSSKRKALEIKFLNGHVYRYYSVPYKVYRNIARAKSHGKNFWKNVRRPLPGGRYRYRRIV